MCYPPERGESKSEAIVTRLSAWVAVVVAVVVMARSVPRPVYGEHVFRQCHVAANLDKLVATGAPFRHGTYNLDMPGLFYDFPAYQWVVVGAAQLVGADPVATGRVVNIALALLAVALIGPLLAALGASAAHVAAARVAFATTPIVLFYFAAPMVDPLAVVASIVALTWYARVEVARQPWSAVGAVAAFGAAVLGALIKPPVFVPIAVAILVHAVATHRLRAVARPAALVVGVAVVVALLGHRALGAWLNAGVAMPNDDLSVVLGSAFDRFDPATYAPIAIGLRDCLLGALNLALLLPGVIVVAASRIRGRALLFAWGLGAVVYPVLFVPMHRLHTYYHLPLVLPLVVFAAAPIAWAAQRIRQRAVRAGLVVAYAAGCALAAQPGYDRLATDDPVGRIEAGGFVADHTSPDDFVVFVVPGRQTFDPSHLYFAARDGFNLSPVYLDLPSLQQVFATCVAQPRRGRPYRDVALFVPASLVDSLAPRVASLGVFRPVASGAAGRLWRLVGAPPGSDR